MARNRMFLAVLAGCVVLAGCSAYRPERPARKVGTVTVDLTPLAGISVKGKAKEHLLRGLVSSPKWRVTCFDGALLAARRSMDPWPVDGLPVDRARGLFWTSAYRSLISTDGWPEEGEFPGSFSSHTILRFSAYRPPDPEVGAEPYTSDHNKALPGSKTVAVDLWGPTPYNHMTEANLQVPLGEIYLELGEDSRYDCGKVIQARVKEVAADLRRLLAATRFAGWQPPHLRVSGGRGLYRVWGAVNPGERGYVYLKAWRRYPDRRTELTVNKEDTVEYVGWSDDPSLGFPFESEVIVMKGSLADEGVLKADFDLWFQPASGKPPRVLLTKTAVIRAWRR